VQVSALALMVGDAMSGIKLKAGGNLHECSHFKY
jgi:hypothetical protein